MTSRVSDMSYGFEAKWHLRCIVPDCAPRSAIPHLHHPNGVLNTTLLCLHRVG